MHMEQYEQWELHWDVKFTVVLILRCLDIGGEEPLAMPRPGNDWFLRICVSLDGIQGTCLQYISHRILLWFIHKYITDFE